MEATKVTEVSGWLVPKISCHFYWKTSCLVNMWFSTHIGIVLNSTFLDWELYQNLRVPVWGLNSYGLVPQPGWVILLLSHQPITEYSKLCGHNKRKIHKCLQLLMIFAKARVRSAVQHLGQLTKASLSSEKAACCHTVTAVLGGHIGLVHNDLYVTIRAILWFLSASHHFSTCPTGHNFPNSIHWLLFSYKQKACPTWAEET